MLLVRHLVWLAGLLLTHLHPPLQSSLRAPRTLLPRCPPTQVSWRRWHGSCRLPQLVSSTRLLQQPCRNGSCCIASCSLPDVCMTWHHGVLPMLMEVMLVISEGMCFANLHTCAAGEGSAAALGQQPSGSVESQRSHSSRGLSRESEGAPATSLWLHQDLILQPDCPAFAQASPLANSIMAGSSSTASPDCRTRSVCPA